VKSKGFTLLETLIALVILAGGLALLVTSWSGSFMRLRKTQFTYEFSLLLEKKMGEVEFEYRGQPIASIPEEKEGDFGEDYQGYTWKLTSKKMEFPDLSQFLASNQGGEKNNGSDQMTQMIIKQLITLMNNSVKEVTVTVLFSKGNSKPIEHSITTLFVDYNAVAGLASGSAGNPLAPGGRPQ
jgi:general secretion pathway protein I